MVATSFWFILLISGAFVVIAVGFILAMVLGNRQK